MADVVRRRSARVLVVDGEHRVLLMQGYDPANPSVRYWFTPGGGIEPGESAAEAAVRELYEETGLRVRPAELGEPVWHDVDVFPFEGRTFEQSQDFFVLQVDAFDAVATALESHETRSVAALAWWPLADLETTAETFYPVGLVDLVRELIAG